MRALVLGNMTDQHTGLYICRAFKSLGHEVVAIDVRKIVQTVSGPKNQEIILDEVNKQTKIPDVVITMKGKELTLKTLRTLKTKYPKAKFIDWFFDIYLNEKYIWNTPEFFKAIELYDYFICAVKGVSDKLKEQGVDNVYYIDQACDPEFNNAVYLNNFQKRKYGSDVTFVGSLGYLGIHKNRLETLSRIATEGFDLKIWGNVICEWKMIPPILRPLHTKTIVMNQDHSSVVQSSLITLGIDAEPTLDAGWSVRLFKVLCAGGCYLTNNTKGLSNLFKINKEDENITDDQDMVVYYNLQDLVDKLDFLLEHDDIRTKIAENGRKTVLEKHTYKHRIEELLKLIGEK